MVVLSYVRILLFLICFSQGSVGVVGKITQISANLLLSPTVKEF